VGVEPDQVRHQVEAIMTRGERLVRGEIGLTPQVKKVVALAIDEAQRFGHRSVGTEHLLIALIRLDEGIAADVLKRLGVDLEQVRAQTLAELSTLPEGQAERICARCGTPCPVTFRFCFNCGQSLNHEE
jgi:ATP-dependent Clp protease ATP-binding subunit ClpC